MTDFNIRFAELAIEWAEAKVPYQHRGLSRNGCDCFGLLVGIWREMGYFKKYVLKYYPPDWNLHAGAGNQVIEELSLYGVQVKKNEIKRGDIAILFFGKCPAHCGIIVSDKLMMVHSLSTKRCCTYGILNNSMWSRRWQTTFRMDENKLRAYDLCH